MSLRVRVSRMRAAVSDRDRAERAFLVVWEPVDPSRADQRPPGVYRQGNVVEVVHEGEEPDPAIRARVREMVTPTALEIVCGPEVVPPPGSDADLVDVNHGRRW